MTTNDQPVQDEAELRKLLDELREHHVYSMVYEPARSYVKGFIHIPLSPAEGVETEWYIESGGSAQMGFDTSDVYRVYHQPGSYWVVQLYQRVDIWSVTA